MRNLLVLICLACFCKAEAQNPSALTMADSLYAVGNYGDAITKYLDISPKNEGIYLKIARAYQARGTFGDALKKLPESRKGREKYHRTQRVWKAAYYHFTLSRGRQCFYDIDKCISAKP